MPVLEKKMPKDPFPRMSDADSFHCRLNFTLNG